MKRSLILLTLLGILSIGSRYVQAQSIVSTSLPQMEVTFDPVGYIFYGPSITVGAGLNDQLSFYGYFRGFGRGLRTVAIKSDPNENDDLSGMNFGVGLSCFLGEDGHGVFIGPQAEFGSSDGLWAKGDDHEWYETSKNLMVALRGGYRLVLNDNLFLNFSTYAGVLQMKNTWDYSDMSYGITDPEPREHTSRHFVIAPEIALVIRLK